MNRQHLIRRIHAIAYGRLKLEEGDYRTLLATANDRGKTSTKDLTDGELLLVLAALQRLSGSRAAASVNEPQHKMIARLMHYLGWSWQQTAKLCKRITGYDDTRKCSAAELRKLITAMIAIVEQNHASGKRTLSHTELFDFRRYTRRPRAEAIQNFQS
jgi:phage gp16-like protein